MDLQLCQQSQDGQTIVAVRGELDLSGLAFMVCAGVRTLTAAQRWARQFGALRHARIPELTCGAHSGSRDLTPVLGRWIQA